MQMLWMEVRKMPAPINPNNIPANAVNRAKAEARWEAEEEKTYGGCTILVFEGMVNYRPMGLVRCDSCNLHYSVDISRIKRTAPKGCRSCAALAREAGKRK